LSSWASSVALAGPLYDPFLEDFQVGAFSDTAGISLVDGLPADLLQPILLDEAWLAGAESVLASEQKNHTVTLVRLMADDEAAANKSLREMQQALADFKAHQSGSPTVDFLRYERLAKIGRAHV